MWCRRVRNQISAYMDGELALAEARALEQHLSQCEGCAMERDSLDRLTRMTSLIPEEDVPLDLHSRIMSRVAYGDAAVPTAMRARRALPSGPFVWMAMAGATATMAFAYAQVRSTLPSPGQGVYVETPVPACTVCPVPGFHPSGDHPSKVVHTAPGASAPGVVRRDSAHAAVASKVVPSAAENERSARTVQRVPREDLATTPSTLPGEGRPQPVAITAASGKPVVEARPSEPEAPSVVPVAPQILGMPGDPIVNSTGPVQPLGSSEPVVAMEKEAGMRMAGPGAMEEQAPVDDEEGLRSLRMFFEERNRMVPQPPALDLNRPRRNRKSL